jgi:hypothetical protein
MIRSEFEDIIINTITEGGRIPTKPNKKAFDTIINNAIRWFHQNDDHANEFEYILIKSSSFRQPLFKQKRQIELPPCIHAITEVKEVNRPFSYNGLLAQHGQSAYARAMMMGGNSDDMVMGVVNSYYNSFVLNNFSLTTIAFEFNPYSRMLTIKGRTPPSDIVCDAYINIPSEQLFENDRFHRYVAGKCRESIGAIFSVAEIALLGGGKLTMDKISDKGEKQVEKVEEEIEKQRKMNFISYL